MSPISDTQRLEAAQTLLGHRFADLVLLDRALTHPSFVNDPDCRCDYERLEFLGDAVLGLIVVDETFARYPDLPEGTMTKVKIAVVAGTTLLEVAADLGLAGLIKVGESERGTGGRGMASALENAFEALVGALYLDGGLDIARQFVLKVLGDRITPESALDLEHPKSRLQELVQSHGGAPEYRIVDVSGAPHDRTFTAEVIVEGRSVGTGSGPSKKLAEMNAAAAAIERLAEE